MVYYLVLWFISIFSFLMLNFSKHWEVILEGLTSGEKAVNFVLVMPLVWVLTILLAGLSVLVERKGLPRLAHFIIFFFFITINIWSLKYEAEVKLANLHHDSLARIGLVLLSVALIISALAAWKRKDRIEIINTHGTTLLKILVGLSTIGILGFFSPGPKHPNLPETDKPNIIIVTFDALSAKHMSSYGYDRETTPNIDSVASESLVFNRFHSNYNYTPASLTSLSGNLADIQNLQMWSEQPNLFSVLRANGYFHQGFYSFWSSYSFFHLQLPGNSITRSGRGSLIYRAYNRLFKERHLLWLSQLLSEEPLAFVPYFPNYYDEVFWKRNQRPGDQSFDSALEYLNKHQSGAVVWVHLWEPHYPYWPDPEFVGKFGPYEMTPPLFINRPYRPENQYLVDGLRNRYDEMICTADNLFGEFLEQLKSQGLYENSYLVIAADHGESLNHGFIGHSGSSVLESITHIPLIIHQPGQKEEVRIETPASAIDFTPTILGLLGIPPAPSMPGESLLPYIEAPTKISERIRFTVSYSAVYSLPGDIALYWKNYKAVYQNHSRENVTLYDIDKDPDAIVDLAPENPQLVEQVMKMGGVW